MAERLNKIPRIVERQDGIDKAMPLTLFDAASTDELLKIEKQIILPKKSKVVFDVGLYENNPHLYQSLGTITVNQELAVSSVGRQSDIFVGMPEKSSMVILKPDSDERRALKIKYDEIVDDLKPLYRLSAKLGIDGKIKKAEDQKKMYQERIDNIDSILCKEFVSQRQEELEFFRINPDEVRRIRLQAAIDRKLAQTNLISIGAQGPVNRS